MPWLYKVIILQGHGLLAVEPSNDLFLQGYKTEWVTLNSDPSPHNTCNA